MTFHDLGLHEPILRAVAAEGYAAPTPIQRKAIPHVLAGSDLLGCAQTGTGKTAAFALPILHRLHGGSLPSTNGHQPGGGKHKPRAAHHTRALILAPTRELAAQIGDCVRDYGANTRLKHAVIFGGVNQHHQVRALQSGVDILVATPGRLLDLMNQGFVDLRAVEVFVLDEADRMLDMGFIPDIRRIVAKLPTKRQTLMFSATMPPDIRALANSILHKPVAVQVDPPASTVETIAQSVFMVARRDKPALLAHLIKSRRMGRTLVFTRTKHGADKVVKELVRCGIAAQAIHGNKSQNARIRALDSFKSTTPPVLVATDIASRGIDVDDITHVVNFDIPNIPETYVHRIGRTARAGASGIAVSFCDHEERGDLRAIERLIKRDIEVCADEKFEALPPRPHSPRGEHERRSSTHDQQGRGQHRERSNGRPSKNHRSRTAPAAHHVEPAKSPRRGIQQRGRGPGRGASRTRRAFAGFGR